MVFIEAPIFTKYIYNYLDDEDYSALQQTLALRPDAGKVIPGSGGLRKLRWAGSGRGKRGGLRIIYYWLSEDGQIWLLTVYAKNEAENIPNSVLKLLRKVPDDVKMIREHVGLSQAVFAGILGISKRTLQDWEQGRRHPTGSAKALLRIAYKHPEVLTS